jgi:anaerobic selenocysteine-containing dehydrogenase
MVTIHTACTYDCPDACCLRVSVDAEGQVSHIRGDPEHPVTRGFVCYRVHRHKRLLRHPDRLASPLVRDGDGFRPIDWDKALDLCAGELRSTLEVHGPGAVLHIGGGGSLALSKELVGRFFRSLGPITTVHGGICGEAGERAQRVDFGDCACHDYTDLRHSAAVVLWGKNPVASGVHLVPFLHDARDRGAPVWVINPCPSESHRLADHVVCPAPGSDGWLALAVLRRLHERGALRDGHRVENLDAVERLLRGLDPERCARRCDVPAEQIEALADLYSRRPVATWIGWGLQRSAAGGHAVRCIDALCLLSGQVGVRGGGANFSSGRSRGLDRSMFPGGSGRTVGAATLGRDIAAQDRPPIRFVYVACANPVTQHADSGACRRALGDPDRFVVVADAFLTDTARAADLVLPVALMLEEERDVVGSYQHHHVARVQRVVPPPAGVRSDLQIVQELSRRLGRPRDDVLDEPAATVERMSAAWFTRAHGARWARNPAQPEVPHAGRFATPSGKARLVAEPPPEPPDLDPADLLFLTVSSRRWQTSQLPEDEQQGPARCTVSAAAARRAGVEAGQRARLTSPLGAMEVVVELSDAIHPSACLVHRGGWVCRGRGVNLLVEGVETDLGQGTAFYSQRVRLEPLG